MAKDLPEEVSAYEVVKRFIKSIDKGLLKVMSKMGISTYQSYCGAQIFDAVGLSRAFVDKFFFGTATTIEGAGLDEIAEETARRHPTRSAIRRCLRTSLEVGGEYAYRLRGEAHCWTPRNRVAAAARGARQCARQVRGLRQAAQRAERAAADHSRPVPHSRRRGGRPRAGRRSTRSSRPSSIVKRFATGAMSFGSISREAHTTLAIAMNRIGGKSNTGEGGEESDRFKRMANGDSMRSAIKQVASGRFGVTAEYLVNSDMMQIKMAQGAKPGEGGQLPGHKVDAVIAKVRHSTQGVGLISPPPHHDIYSIEDLKQLVFDLKNVNPQALVSVKLVSEVGVGTVAAGVAKCKADHVTISGFEGGTGASPLTSIKHAGSPWEIGLAETHQTLVMNGLRSRIAVQVDGGVRTGRDVVIGALLGADEFGFATAPLIAAGCIMMRKCHLNTCPVGVATQDPVLRKRFVGQPEHVINFFFFVAEEVRAADGGDRLPQLRRDDRPDARCSTRPRSSSRPRRRGSISPRCSTSRRPGPATRSTIARRRITARPCARPPPDRRRPSDAIERGKHVRLELPIRNSDRSTGAMLSGEIARRYGHAGLRDEAIHIKFKGTAGQSFGAFLAKGVTLELEGEANDYVGKGLSGGRIVVYPPKEAVKLVRRRNRSSSATPCSTARSPANATSAASPASASACAIPARSRSSKGRGRSWLRIHDRRHRRRHRRDRAQLRRRHVGRHRLCARRGRRFRPTLQPRDGRTRAGRGAKRR